MTLPIEISLLSKLFRGKKRQHVEALRELSFNINPGEVFGFLGPNGAGKSTTIKILMGLIAPTSGSARLFGRPVTDVSARQSVGYLPENPAFYDFLTAREYLSFVGSTFKMENKDIVSRSEKVLDQFELTVAADRRIRSYSKGMVQRLGLAQALLNDPDLYILDEPMSGLDPLGRALVKNVIKELKQRGKTVFFSTHITADVEAVCDRVGVVVNGKLEALETVEGIMQSGVKGYTVQVSAESVISLNGFVGELGSSGFYEFQVEKERFNDFVALVAVSGGKIEYIDTVRKDLEEFFLGIVKQQHDPA